MVQRQSPKRSQRKLASPTMPRQLGPKGHSDLRTSLLHRSHAARVADACNRLRVQVRGNFAIYYRISQGVLGTDSRTPAMAK